MPRTLEFDRERALIRAMKLFWAQGYNATSLSALLNSMEIQRSSFYASFGDKKSLFIECLRLFGERTAKLALADDDQQQAPEQQIWRFFAATLLDVPDARLQHGCLLVNSILELADTDPQLCALSSQQLAAVERALESALEQARQQGRWHSQLSATQAARYLTTINQGLRVQSRKGLSRQELWDSLETALQLIGLPPRGAPASH